MGAHFVNTAEVDPPVVVGTDTSTYTTLLPGAAGREATNSGAANAGTRAIVIPQATVVTPEDDDGPKPTIVASMVLPFYRRKGFVYVMVAMALLGLLAIGIATAVQLSNSGSETYLAHHQAKLLAPDGSADDKFGLSVAIYVDPDGSANDRFGKSVAIYEDIIVVGADGDGSAHVFVRSGEEWAHQAKLLAPDGAADDRFGRSVAIYEDTIVVGAYRDDDNGFESGSAHVFVRSGEVWTHQ
ncbi:hypothetical protein THAOC_18849, partial [Thalassiosira oceanica]